MASIFMRIDGLNDIKGAATIGEIGGKKGFFAVNKVDWGANRGVAVDVGNSNNADRGMVSMDEIGIERMSDGASPYLTTFLFAPGDDGKTVEVLLTKPSRDGSGSEPYMVLTLEGARMSHYDIAGTEGDLPSENFRLTYNAISIVYYQEDAVGKIVKGATIKFNCETNTLESKAQ